MNKNQNNNFHNENTPVVPDNDHSKQDTDAIDYVLPTAKKKHYHSNSSDMTIEEKELEAKDFVYAVPHKKKHKRKKNKWLKVLGIIMSIIAAILIVLVSTILIFNQVGKSAMHDYEDMTIEPSPQIEDIEAVEDSGKTITYKGSTYSFNEEVASVVLMGVDIKDFEYPDREVGEAGQADAIYIAVIDTSKDKVTILGVSRDAMVDVNVYNTDGGFVGTENMQLCLSYAYGDGAHTSCENTLTSLERLFYGMQFDTYFSIDTRALETLTDTVGGVTVTSLVDFYSDYYGRTISEDETVTLYGNDATIYIRSRDLDELGSNNDRMARQKQFMTAFLAQAWPSIKSDTSVIVDLYNGITGYSTTNLTTSKMTYLATTAISGLDSYKEVEFINVPGTVTKGEYAEFNVDQDALMELMLDIFYIEVS